MLMIHRYQEKTNQISTQVPKEEAPARAIIKMHLGMFKLI